MSHAKRCGAPDGAVTRLNPDQPERAAGPATTVALGILWLYQRTLSPVFYFLGARCRHEPSCSHYAADAFRRHGVWAGWWLAFSRLARCHPFGSHGWDPVPEETGSHGWRFWRHGDWAWTERPRDGFIPPSKSST